ncbi:MAG: DUF1501 domain-containing protein, partial [Verrucomicrobiota bacterium]
MSTNRRDFLQQLGLGGIALHALLAGETSRGAMPPRSARYPARARNVIFLFMCGGASHLETFDYKPALRDVAGKTAVDLFGSENLDGFNPEKAVAGCRILPPVFSFRQHGQTGAWVSQIYPCLTRVVDEICFIKSMHTDSAIHSVGQTLMHTGHGRTGFPSIGSWVTYGLGCETDNLPAYVVMKDGLSTTGDTVLQQGMLPSRYQAAVAKV